MTAAVPGASPPPQQKENMHEACGQDLRGQHPPPASAWA